MIGLKQKLIERVAALANRLGYRIERKDGLADMPRLDIFELAARDLMTSVGTPFLLQVGAFDGISLDPVRHLILAHGWAGLLVEPQPVAFANLILNYATQPQLKFENAALGEQDGEAKLYMLAAADGTPLAAVEASFTERNLRRHTYDNAPICSVTVPTLTIPSLLAKHNVDKVDILQVDTEGFDAEVVRMVIEAKIEPALIRYEHVHLSTATRTRCAQLLANHGYLLHRDDIDTIAYKSSHQ